MYSLNKKQLSEKGVLMLPNSELAIEVKNIVSQSTQGLSNTVWNENSAAPLEGAKLKIS